MKEVRLIVRNVNDENRREKFTSAVESLAKALFIPYTVRPREKEDGEKYVYESQGDLARKWSSHVAMTLDSLYADLVRILDLPMVTTFSKAIGESEEERRPVSEAILYRGKVVFNPETGQPIYREDFEKIIKAIERFLNKRLDNAAKKIVLDSVALGRVLARKLVNMPSEEVRKLRLGEMTWQEKPVEWISDNMKWMDESIGKMDVEERSRLKSYYRGLSDFVEVSEQNMGNHITRMQSKIVFDIRDTIVGGVMQRKSKKEIAQDLFDEFGDLNRDWERIADTEVMNASNTAFLRETVRVVGPGKAVYFRRVEMKDKFVCKFCEKIRGMIVRWSDTPLADEHIDDPHAEIAIWEGKSNVGRKAKDYWVPSATVHPWCRGSWERWIPGIKG